MSEESVKAFLKDQQYRIEKLESQLAEREKEIEKLRIIDKYRTCPTPQLLKDFLKLEAESDRLRAALEEIERGDSHAHDCVKINTSCDCDQIVAEEALADAKPRSSDSTEGV